MDVTCVVVADRVRARFFLTEESQGNHPSRRFKLVEIEALANPAGELTGLETFSNTRSGSDRAPNGAQYDYDDHRERYREEVQRRFAKHIATEIQRVVKAEAPARTILAVEPHLLGLLRPEMPRALPGETAIVEMPIELSWRTPEHIRQVLEARGAFSPARST